MSNKGAIYAKYIKGDKPEWVFDSLCKNSYRLIYAICSRSHYYGKQIEEAFYFVSLDNDVFGKNAVYKIRSSDVSDFEYLCNFVTLEKAKAYVESLYKLEHSLS